MNNQYHRLTLAEREQISQGLWADESFGQIAIRINRNPSTISREVKRSVKKKRRSYSAIKAQIKTDLNKKKRGRKKKLENNAALKEYIYDGLKQEWSPEEIAKRIKLEYSDDMTMRISHETIYQYLYCLPRGELKKELMKSLRQERKYRQSRKNAHYRRQRIPDIISISE